MNDHDQPRWSTLNSILLVFLLAIIIEPKLPIPSVLDRWLDGLLVVLFYGGMAFWIWHNSRELEGTKKQRIAMRAMQDDQTGNERN